MSCIIDFTNNPHRIWEEDMKPYYFQLLSFVHDFTNADAGQMTLSRVGPTTNPDPSKTSWNDSVAWKINLIFGRGYFSGAMVEYVGDWQAAHDGRYEYNRSFRDLPIEDAVRLFLIDSIPDWAAKKEVGDDKKGSS